MNNCKYALKQDDYSWQNALLGGNCAGHAKKASEGSSINRVVHLIIALGEVLPIIGQISSIAEKLMVTYYRDMEFCSTPYANRINNKSRPINQIPEELFFNILSYLPSSGFRSSSLVCTEWNNHTNNPLPRMNALYEKFAVGDKKWKQWFGKGIVTEKERNEDFKSLPKDIFKILETPCPVFSGKKVRDTHILFKTPTTINGESVTITSIGKLLKKHFSNTKNGYIYILSEIVTSLSKKTIKKSEWVLLTKELIPGSRNRTYNEQQTLVSDLKKNSKAEYQVPKTIEVIVGVFAEYLRSGTRLLNNNDIDLEYTYTRCQNQAQAHQLVVGGFGPAGLVVQSNDFDYDYFGVLALRKF